ncbi:MAG: sugar phosphate isomerase/epimerase family protein [Acutalibacteraceae bacterium]
MTDNLFYHFSIDEGMKIFKDAGFDAVDFSMFYMNNSDVTQLGRMSEDALVGALNEAAAKYSLPFNQAHAPFPSYRFGDNEYNEFIYDKIKLAVRIAGRIGADQIIVHPTACPDGVDQKQFNIDFYNSLAPLCEEFNIKIALENMFGNDRRRGVKVANVCSYGEDLAEYYDALDPKYFTVCLDIGHSGLVGDDAPHAIRVLGHDRLTALHVHDNDYIDDLHMPPFTYKLDWKEIARALHDINYSGDVTLEDDGFVSRLPKRALVNAIRMTADLAAELRDMIAL